MPHGGRTAEQHVTMDGECPRSHHDCHSRHTHNGRHIGDRVLGLRTVTCILKRVGLHQKSPHSDASSVSQGYTTYTGVLELSVSLPAIILAILFRVSFARGKESLSVAISALAPRVMFLRWKE